MILKNTIIAISFVFLTNQIVRKSWYFKSINHLNNPMKSQALNKNDKNSHFFGRGI